MEEEENDEENDAFDVSPNGFDLDDKDASLSETKGEEEGEEGEEGEERGVEEGEREGEGFDLPKGSSCVRRTCFSHTSFAVAFLLTLREKEI